MQSVEKFAKETAEKYAELTSHQKQLAKQKQITQLKDSNQQLKNVSNKILRYFLL